MTGLQFEVVTLFPAMIDAPCAESILGKAQAKGLLTVRTRDLRPYGEGRHRVTDDAPYGGGAGMVMKPEPLVRAIEDATAALVAANPGVTPRVLLMDPQGRPFTQTLAREFAAGDAFVIVCGRYEGVDERVRAFVHDAVSVGDFVLTGGEFAALCIIDATARLRPGVLGNDTSAVAESFSDGLLEGPQYTRPPEWRGRSVPDILVGGDHAKVAIWRRKEALRRTLKVRPDVIERLEQLDLTEKDRRLLAEVRAETESTVEGAPPPGDRSSGGTTH